MKTKLAFLFFTLIYLFSSTVVPVFANRSYTYDANGNMTSDGVYCYTFNDANQVSQVKNCSNSQVIAQYIYDYQGNRIVKKIYANGVISKTVYSPDKSYETTKLANGTTSNTSYYYVNDDLVAKKNPDGSKNYYLADNLHSTSVLTDQSGTVVENSTYYPYGDIRSGGTKSKYLYTGQESDSETNLDYYNARYYYSHIRRFTQPDDQIAHIYNPQELNRYSYVNNNPLTYNDPSGHNPIVIAAIVSGVLGGTAGYAEVKLTNPHATPWDYAKGIGVGTVAGAGAGVAGAFAVAGSTALLAGSALSSGAVSIASDIVGGAAGGFVGNGIHNSFDRKNFLDNAPEAITIGGLTGGISGNIAGRLVPVGIGRPATKLNWTVNISTLGTNSLLDLQRHTLDEGINNLLNIPVDTLPKKRK